jgi:hypothetical protein
MRSCSEEKGADTTGDRGWLLLLWRGGVASAVVVAQRVVVVAVAAPVVAAVVEAASWKSVEGKHRILFRSNGDGEGGDLGEAEEAAGRDGVGGSEEPTR